MSIRRRTFVGVALVLVSVAACGKAETTTAVEPGSPADMAITLPTAKARPPTTIPESTTTEPPDGGGSEAGGDAGRSGAPTTSGSRGGSGAETGSPGAESASTTVARSSTRPYTPPNTAPCGTLAIAALRSSLDYEFGKTSWENKIAWYSADLHHSCIAATPDNNFTPDEARDACQSIVGSFKKMNWSEMRVEIRSPDTQTIVYSSTNYGPCHQGA